MQNKKIKITSGEKEYVLEYNRQSVQQMEKMGLAISKIEDNMMTTLPLLFRGAFLKNHSYEKESVINELYDKISNKKGLNEKLMEMVTECYTSLLEDGDEGNVGWEIV